MSVERAVWTDERLDDLARRIDAGFGRVDADIRELRQELSALRIAMLQVGVALFVGLIGVIATVLFSS